MPIKSLTGTILGTFGTYFRNSRPPTAEDKTGVEHLAVAELGLAEPPLVISLKSVVFL